MTSKFASIDPEPGRISLEDIEPEFFQDEDPVFEQLEEVDPEELLEDLDNFDDDELY